MVAVNVSGWRPTAWRQFGGRLLFLLSALFWGSVSDAEITSYIKQTQLPPNLQGALITEGRDGVYYGVARKSGNTSETNELFRLNNRGERQVLHRFSPQEGVVINSPPLMAGDGLIYGSTGSGGENQTGTIYRYDPRTGRFTKLIDFPSDYLQGAQLTCIGPDGDLYGICSRAAGNEAGLIFRCTRRGELSIIHQFGNEQLPPAEPGSTGNASLRWPRMLRLGSDGWLYGSTQSGGPIFQVQHFAGRFPESYGALFRCSTAGALQILATFNPTTGPAPSEIVEGPDGALYGFVEHHEYRDSENHYKAQLLRITQDGQVSILHTFPEHQLNGFTDFRAGPILGGDGRMFAIRPGSGPDQGSRLFEFTPQGAIGDVFTFSRSDGVMPPGSLTFGSNGVFRGIASGHYQFRHFFTLSGDFGPPISLPPIARDDHFEHKGKPILLPVLKNDKGRAWLTEWTQPASGTVSLADDGVSLLYEPDPTGPALQRFTYRLVDVAGDYGEAVATVYLRRATAGGTYAGFPTGGDGSEYIRVRLNKSGLLSGVLFTSGRRFQLRGGLDENQEFTFQTNTLLQAGNAQIRLTLRHDSADNRNLDVTLEIGNVERRFLLEKQPAYTPDAAGLYTFILPPSKDQPTRYSGTGYGLLRITATGHATAAGKLADGKAFSIGGHVSELNSASLFKTLYREQSVPVPPAGFLRVSIQLEAKPGEYDCSGEMQWNRPSTYRDGREIPAVDQNLKLIGSRWIRGFQLSASGTPGTPAENAQVLLPDPKVENSPFAVSLEGNRFFDNHRQISGLIDPRTGFMTGTMFHPRSGINTPFAGVVMPASENGAGQFFTPEGTRTFELRPR